MANCRITQGPIFCGQRRHRNKWAQMAADDWSSGKELLKDNFGLYNFYLKTKMTSKKKYLMFDYSTLVSSKVG